MLTKRSTQVISLLPGGPALARDPSKGTVEKNRAILKRGDEGWSAKKQKIQSSRPYDGRKASEQAVIRRVAQTVTSDTARSPRLGSPWTTLQKRFGLELDQWVTVAEAIDSPGRLFIVKVIEGPDAASQMQLLKTARHENLHTGIECFNDEGIGFVICDYTPITLAHVAKSVVRITEPNLAAILSQVLEGLKFLAENGLLYTSLRCSSILVDTEGHAKIAGYERCTGLDSSGLSFVPSELAGVVMELMQGYPKREGFVGLEEPGKWSVDSLDFLSMVDAGVAVDRLVQHRFLRCEWKIEDLKWIVELAKLTTSVNFALVT